MSDNSLASVLAIVLEAKGGSAKTFTTGLIAATAEAQGLRAGFLDSDGSNSATIMAFEGAEFVNLSRKGEIGPALTAMRKVSDGTLDCAIWDTGARDEQAIRELLPTIVRQAEQRGISVVAFRPITSNHYVQRNATTFLDLAEPLGIGVVFCSILAQGRTRHDMRYWEKSEARAKAIRYAVEIDIEDVGAFAGDNINSFGLSLADVAQGRFSRLTGDEKLEAENLFDEGFQLYVADYLVGMTECIGAAVQIARKRAATVGLVKKARKASV